MSARTNPTRLASVVFGTTLVAFLLGLLASVRELPYAVDLQAILVPFVAIAVFVLEKLELGRKSSVGLLVVLGIAYTTGLASGNVTSVMLGQNAVAFGTWMAMAFLASRLLNRLGVSEATWSAAALVCSLPLYLIVQ